MSREHWLCSFPGSRVTLLPIPGGCSCLGKEVQRFTGDSSMGWAGLVAASRGSRPTSCATSSHHSVSHNSRAASVPPTLQNEVLPLWCCSTRKQRQQSTHSSQNSCVTSVFLRFPFLFVLNARKQVCYLVV